MKKPINMMEAGPNGNNFQAQALQRHPIEWMQHREGAFPLFDLFLSHYVMTFISIFPFAASQRVSFLGTDEEEEVRRLYGSGFAMKLATERRMATDSHSMVAAGIPTSNMTRDILVGNDMKLGFEDVLNLPQNRPIYVKHQEDPHSVMERTLGMM